jgi:hypothetical protein
MREKSFSSSGGSFRTGVRMMICRRVALNFGMRSRSMAWMAGDSMK